MKTSKAALDQIAKYEGIRLKAYRCPAGVLTVGVGHTGPDVYEGMTITHDQAMAFFADDIKASERAVEKLGMELTQGQLDSLVSFCYNCGVKNLKKLCTGRTKKQIADAIPAYNKAKDPKTGKMVVLPGLVKRRAWERGLFAEGLEDAPQATRPTNPYPVPDKPLRRGSRGVTVRWLQRELVNHGYDILVDGDFGPKTAAAVRDFQLQNDLVVDEIVGKKTVAALLK